MPGSLSGRRVLLVEDYLLNQMLVRRQLEPERIVLDIAENGVRAVEMVRDGAYEAVLMDMQLPEMDGLAATRAIRALPGPASRVPIVAMTATTFGDQRAACLDAGMDDYLEKPADPDTLLEMLARVLAADYRPARCRPVDGDTPLPPIEGLLVERGLAFFARDAVAYRMALQHFARQYQMGLPSFLAWSTAPQAPRPEVLAALGAEVHGLAGACAALGASVVQARAAACEAVLHDFPQDAAEVLPALQQALVRLAAQIRAALAPHAR